jgi:pimeloyl-ACP methyl ester carboxylesterase
MIATDELDSAVVAQEAWSANADHVVRLPGAHMLMLSHPDEVAEALLGVNIH